MLLLAQTFLGMITNLYVSIPARHPGANAGNYFAGILSGVPWAIGHAPVALALHASLGIALAAASLAALARAARTRIRTEIALAALAAATIFGAGFDGGSFLNYNHTVSSLIMTGCALLATAAYTFSLATQHTRPTGPPRPR